MSQELIFLSWSYNDCFVDRLSRHHFLINLGMLVLLIVINLDIILFFNRFGILVVSWNVLLLRKN